MPRKNPLPKREIEICRRLREFRRSARISRVELAKAAGVDSTALANVEYLHSPLRYGIAYNLWGVLRFNPEWLATGKGPRAPGHLAYSPMVMEAEANRRFSEVFEQQNKATKMMGDSQGGGLGEGWGKIGFRPDGRGRVIAETILVDRVRQWLLHVPDADLNKLVNKVLQFGDKLSKAYRRDSGAVVEKRGQEIEAARAVVEARWGLIESAAEKSKAGPN